MSTSVAMVNSGTVALDSAIRRAMTCWVRVSSWTLTSPLAVPVSATLAAGAAGAAGTAAAAACGSAAGGASGGAAGAARPPPGRARAAGRRAPPQGPPRPPGGGRGRGGRGAPPGGARLAVGLHDPPAGARARQRGGVDPLPARDPPRAGRALGAPAVALRRRRSRWRRGRLGLGLRR